MDTHSTEVTQVGALLQRLTQGPLSLASLELGEQALLALGLVVADGKVRLPAGVEMLDEQRIVARLPAATANWLREIRVFPAIDSTNTWQMQQAAHRDIDGVIALAECQIAGRGRRGRQWQSPVGSNLAVSLGFSFPQPVSELGGLSLAVGLAAVDALDPQGQLGVRLKWPNDLLVGNAKLSGILVEVSAAANTLQVCVGIGVNWRIPPAVRAEIDQPIADMAGLNAGLGRNEGASALIASIVEFVQRFAEQGFGPMAEVYSALHAFQGQDCTVFRPQGNVLGRVLGVTEGGLLRVQTAGGEQQFGSGEVWVRSL